MNLKAFGRRLTGRARAALNRPRELDLDRPRRVHGVELIGQYQDSGFKEPPYLVRRPDGQVVQLSQLLFLVTAEADGTRDLRQLATAISRRSDRPLSPDNVSFLIDKKLRPAGLIHSHNRTTSQPRRLDPLFALRHRAAVVPPAAVRAAARTLRPLFMPVVIGAALSWLVALDLWLAHHGLGSAVSQLIARPILLLALLGLVIVSAVWHELGHATACTYGGATPGAMGMGLYVIWPAFYTDVTDAYRMRRGGRLRTDLGGVYFNALFALGAGGAYFATRFEPLLALVAVQHFQIIQQLTPLMRLDGYYVVTDLVGVPDILSRLKPLLLSFLPFRPPDRRVTELKPWVRATTSAYILLFIAASAALLVLVGLGARHAVPAAVRAAEVYSHRAATAWHRRELAVVALAEVQVVSVMLPATGFALGAIRLLRRLARRMSTSVDRRLTLAVGMAIAAVVGFGWPFVLWGLRPGTQARSARASVRTQTQRNSSARRHVSQAWQPGHAAATASAPPTAAAPPPSSWSTGMASSVSASATHGTAPMSSAPAATATAASSGARTSGSPSSGTGSSGTSSAPGGASSTTSTPSGSGSTTTASSNNPSTTPTNTTPTTPATTGTTTTPTTQTTTTTPSG